MVANIVLRKFVNIGVNDKGKFLLNGEKASIKDIPFIRYRFDNYGESEISYIMKMRSKFVYSVPLEEVELDTRTVENIHRLREKIPMSAVYVYMNLRGAESLDDSRLLLEALRGLGIDRIMIRDNTGSMDYMEYLNIKKEVSKLTGLKLDDIGVCHSPLSFSDEACLTALKARDLIANYGTDDNACIPSANHEDMNECGCMRHIEIVNDSPIPVSNTGGGKKSKSSGGVKKSKVSKSKVPIEWV